MQAALAHELRPAADKKRDAKCKPAEVLALFEITKAGFVFDAASERLRNLQDDRGTNVFLAPARGKTDPFVHRYRKPKR